MNELIQFLIELDKSSLTGSVNVELLNKYFNSLSVQQRFDKNESLPTLDETVVRFELDRYSLEWTVGNSYFNSYDAYFDDPNEIEFTSSVYSTLQSYVEHKKKEFLMKT